MDILFSVFKFLRKVLISFNERRAYFISIVFGTSTISKEKNVDKLSLDHRNCNFGRENFKQLRSSVNFFMYADEEINVCAASFRWGQRYFFNVQINR